MRCDMFDTRCQLGGATATGESCSPDLINQIRQILGASKHSLSVHWQS